MTDPPSSSLDHAHAWADFWEEHEHDYESIVTIFGVAARPEIVNELRSATDREQYIYALQKAFDAAQELELPRTAHLSRLLLNEMPPGEPAAAKSWLEDRQYHL